MVRRQMKLVGWLFVAILTACTSENPFSADDETAEDLQQLVINLSAEGDRLTTRAGRPLHSSEPRQYVQHVTLYVTNTQGIVLQKEIGRQEWETAHDYQYGKQLKVTFRDSDGERLPKGDYTIYAVAFSTPTDYTVRPATYEQTTINAISGENFDDEKIVSFDPKNFSAVLDGSKTDGEEIFAGKADVTVNRIIENIKGGNSAVITLNRQVAGTIGYFTNIPAKVGDAVPTRIRLVAANNNNTVNFINMISGETVTSDSDKAATYVVNGSTTGFLEDEMVSFYNTPANKGYVVYEVELADFFPYANQTGKTFADCDLDGDGYVGKKDVDKNIEEQSIIPNFWTNPNDTPTHPQTLENGSVYGSQFLIPFCWKEGYNTFELQLLGTGSSGEDIFLKAWNVKVSKNQLVVDTDIPSVSTGVIVTVEGDKSESCFNVYRNHMYTLGKKTSDTDCSKDVPLDLSREIELVITINTLWKENENMTIN